MRHGFGLFETGFLSSTQLIGFLVIVFLVLVLLFEFRKKSSLGQRSLTEILNVRYAQGEIGEDRYHEINMIIEDEVSETPAMMIAKERFAKGEISSEEFIRTRDFINSDSK